MAAGAVNSCVCVLGCTFSNRLTIGYQDPYFFSEPKSEKFIIPTTSNKLTKSTRPKDPKIYKIHKTQNIKRFSIRKKLKK